MEPLRIRDIGRLRYWEIRPLRELRKNHYLRRELRTSWNPGGFGRLGDFGNCEIREIGENRYIWQTWETLSGRTHGEPANWEIGGLGGSGDWKIREIGMFGRWRDVGDSGDSGNSGDSEIRESRKFGRFGRLGVSGDREIREIGGNHYTWKKIRTSWNPGRLERFGRFGRLGRFGRFGGLGDSGDSGDLRHSGNSGDWGKSLYVAKLENPLEPQRIREIGRFGSLRDSGDSGNWKIREFAGLEDSEDSGGWEIRSFGRLGNSGNWEKSSYVAGVGHASRGEHLESRRVGKLGAWEIRKIGRFGRLGCPGDSGG